MICEKKQILLEHLSSADMKTDQAWAIAGLSDIATAWIMYAYVSKNNSNSFSAVIYELSRVAEMIDSKITNELAMRIVNVIIEQRLTNSVFSQRLCSVILNVPRATYQRYEKEYELIYKVLGGIIDLWEFQAISIIEKHLKRGPL